MYFIKNWPWASIYGRPGSYLVEPSTERITMVIHSTCMQMKVRGVACVKARGLNVNLSQLVVGARGP